MKTLEEVCQDVAKEIGYEDWDQVDCIGETMLKKIVQLYSYELTEEIRLLKKGEVRLINQLDKYAEDLNKSIGRANGLEEWLTEYRDQLKKENAYHKNTGIINAINELLNES
jgi:hypothetical protein